MDPADAPDTAQTRRWPAVARTGVAAMLIAAAVSLLLATFSPVAMQPDTGRSGWWVAVSVVAVLLAWPIAITLLDSGGSIYSDTDVRSIVFGAVLTAGGCAGGWFAYRLIPATSNSLAGVGGRGPLALIGYACVVAAGVLVAVLGRRSGTLGFVPLRGLVKLGGILGVVLVVVAVGWSALAVLDTRTAVQRTTGDTVGSPSAPTLDGAATWTERTTTSLVGWSQWYRTAGGLAERTSTGVRVLDPATGDERWHHYRPDSDGGVFPAATVSDGGRVLAFAGIKIDNGPLRRGGERLMWVHDAVTGAVLAELPVAARPDQTWLAGDLVISHELDEADGEADGAGEPDRRLVARDYDNQVRWTYQLPCEPGDIRGLDGDSGLLAVALSCGRRGPVGLAAISLADGTEQWLWSADQDRQVRVSIWPTGPESGGVLLAGVAMLEDSYGAPVEVTRLDPATGAAQWTTEPLPVDRDTNDARPARGALWAGGTAVLLKYHGNKSRLDVVAFDPATGQPDWTSRLQRFDINLGSLPNLQDEGMTGPVSGGAVGAVAGLADGRVVVADRYDELRVLAAADGTPLTQQLALFAEPVDRTYDFVLIPSGDGLAIVYRQRTVRDEDDGDEDDAPREPDQQYAAGLR